MTTYKWDDLAEELKGLVETAADSWQGCDWDTLTGDAGEIGSAGIDASKLRDAAQQYCDWETDDDVPPQLRDEYEIIADSAAEIYDEMAKKRSDADAAWKQWASEEARAYAVNYALAAAEYAEIVAESAYSAADAGRAAVEALRRGDVSTALAELESASSLEKEYGDDPSWGVTRRWLDAKVEEYGL